MKAIIVSDYFPQPSSMPRHIASVLLFFLILTSSHLSLAEPSAADKAAARALFEEGKTLVSNGDFPSACPKFEEANRLDYGVGTTFHLANCYESVGKLASAWTLFLEVSAKLKEEGDKQREKVARERAAALEPRISKLTIVVPQDNALEGLEIRRDGSLVGEPLWGTPVAIDSGSHEITATAPGRQPWTKSVLVDPIAQALTVEVPQLTPAAAPPPPPPPPPPPARPKEDPQPGKTQRILGIAVGGAGVVLVGTGLFFGLKAKGDLDDAEEYCNGNLCWDQRGVDLHDDAVGNSNLSTILTGLGGAAIVGGTVLYITAPKDKKPGEVSRVLQSVAAGPRGIVWKGEF